MILNILQLFKKKKQSQKNANTYKLDELKFMIIKDAEDIRDFHISKVVAPVILPPKVDLRKWCNPIRYQGGLGSCGGHGYGACLEILRHQKGDLEYDCSELMIYYYSRENKLEDSGIQMRDGAKAVFTYGGSLEMYWPYIESNFAIESSWSAQFVGKFTKASGYYRCYSIADMKQSLANNVPVAIGMQVPHAFMNYSGGIYSTTDGPSMGGHCMAVVGYDDNEKTLLLRNSWATSWGEAGYCRIDYDTFNKLVYDMWVLQI